MNRFTHRILCSASAAAVLALSSTRLAHAQARPAEKAWTLLVYAAADNNADGPVLFFMDRVCSALDGDPGMEVLMLIDRSKRFSDDPAMLGEDFTGARLFRMHRNYGERLDGGAQFPEIGLDRDAEIDTADADNLRRFIAWGKERAPARHYAVLIYGHASGASMCPDEESAHDMGIAEISAKLTEKESIDFLALELCNMGGIEIGYQWRPEKGRFGADVLLAIPNAGPPLAWERAFARIRSSGHASKSAEGALVDPAQMDAGAFGKLVVEEGERGRLAMKAEGENVSHEAAAAYDLRLTKEVHDKVDALAVELSKNAASRKIVLGTKPDRPSEFPMCYGGDGQMTDLYALCARLESSAELSKEARAAAAAARASVDRFVLASFGMDGYPGFEPGKNGVFIVLPKDVPSAWNDFKWYTPLEGRNRDEYGRWAFLADGATPANGKVENWFELLDSWLDVADEKGGVNGYRW